MRETLTAASVPPRFGPRTASLYADDPTKNFSAGEDHPTREFCFRVLIPANSLFSPLLTQRVFLHANGTTKTPSSANAANIAHASLMLQTKADFSLTGRRAASVSGVSGPD